MIIINMEFKSKKLLLHFHKLMAIIMLAFKQRTPLMISISFI